MANQRLYLFIALCFVGLLLFQAWEKDHSAKAPPSAGTATTASTPASSAPTQAAAPPPSDVPSAGASQSATSTPPPPPPPSSPTVNGSGNKVPSAKRIHVRTDLLDVELDTLGGDVRQVNLRKYTVSYEDKTPFRLMTDRGAHLYVAQSGFVIPARSHVQAPSHNAVYSTPRTDYELAPGQKTLAVHLRWTSPDGVQVTKTYLFKRGSYVVGLRYTVKNASGQPWTASFYRQLQRTQYAEHSSGHQMFIHTYMGAAVYTPKDKYDKISFSDIQDKGLNKANIIGGWVAMLQHYFLGAWIPDAKSTDTFYSLYRAEPFHSYIIGAKTPLVTVAPGGERQFDSRLYVGPKLQDQLASVSPGLDLTVDYGMLTVISKPLFKILEFFHHVFGNWGWSIILLTILIKLVFYKLSETSYRSMAKMRRVQPRMQALKERYGDDKQKLNQALMELYKTEKINPLGGCLPIVIQIPVFIALYWVLLESVEMRQAPFIFWIHDLSAADPYYVLPLLMGVTMFLQQRLNPAPMDPLQKKIMMALPLMFTVFFLFFPAGLVLYWVVNNTLSIAQQWVITKRVVEGAAKS
jgi:YidC/Oxa1 family membrane protein insertase